MPGPSFTLGVWRARPTCRRTTRRVFQSAHGVLWVVRLAAPRVTPWSVATFSESQGSFLSAARRPLNRKARSSTQHGALWTARLAPQRSMAPSESQSSLLGAAQHT